MDSNTGYTLADGRDLSSVFMGMSNGVSLTSANVFQAKQTCLGGIDLSACPMFYSMPSTIVSGPTYPIGYTLDISNTIAAVPENVYLTTINSVPNGVWLANATVVLTKGAGITYLSSSFIRFDISGNATTNIFSPPPYPILRFPIQAGNTNSPTLRLAVSGVIVVKQPSSLCVETLLRSVSGTSTSTFNVYFEITKIA